MKRGLEAITKGIGQRRSRYYRTLAVFLCLIVVTAVAMMCIGAVNYTPWYILSVLTGKSTEGIFMIKTLRLPRMLAGLTAGFAFGMAGGVFQTMLRNPLANPNIIGITSASSVGAVFCILILHTQGWTAFGGSILMALLSALLIFILANHKKFTIGKMVLIGLGFQAMMNSIINYLLLIANENDLGTAMRWMSGTLNAVQMNNLYPLFGALLVFVPVILIHSKALRILELGDETAVTRGVMAKAVRAVLLVSSVLLTAVATAATGPIAFVSFLSAPIAKEIAGHGNSSPLAAGLFGSLLGMVSDFIGQYAFETRFPVGIITGLLGAPYLIFLLIKMNRKGEF